MSTDNLTKFENKITEQLSCYLTPAYLYNAIGSFNLNDIIFFTRNSIPKKQLEKIIKLCIKASSPKHPSYNNSFTILFTLNLYGKIKINSTLYSLICSNECYGFTRILNLLYTEQANLIHEK